VPAQRKHTRIRPASQHTVCFCGYTHARRINIKRKITIPFFTPRYDDEHRIRINSWQSHQQNSIRFSAATDLDADAQVKVIRSRTHTHTHTHKGREVAEVALKASREKRSILLLLQLLRYATINRSKREKRGCAPTQPSHPFFFLLFFPTFEKSSQSAKLSFK